MKSIKLTRLLTGGALGILLTCVAPVTLADLGSVTAKFAATGAVEKARGTAAFRVNNGKHRMTARVLGLSSSTPHALTIGGITVSTFTSSRRGGALLRLDDLGLDPRGKAVEIEDEADDEAVLRIADFSGQGLTGNVEEERTLLHATADAPLRAQAKTVFRVRPNGRMIFKVEVNRMPPGTQLQVFGVVSGVTQEIGQIAVGPLGKGELKFDTNTPDEPNEVAFPGGFDPAGAIEIRQDGATLFTGSGVAQTACTPEMRVMEIPPAPGAVLPAGAEAEGQLKTQADCEIEFEVELRNVADGSYDVFVGGELAENLRGTIQVVAGRGEIEFEADPEDVGEALLNFTVLEQPIFIKRGATTLFATDRFNPVAVVTACAFQEVQIALENPGPDANAKGTARLRTQEDCDKDFRVQVENLADGNYDLFVGGSNRGTLTVTGERGEIEFETVPDDAGELPLNFEVSGQPIEIKQGGTTFLRGTITAL